MRCREGDTHRFPLESEVIDAGGEAEHSRFPGDGLSPVAAAEFDRKTFLTRALLLALGASPAAGLLAACGGSDPHSRRGMADGMMEGSMPGWMMSEGPMDAAMMADMRVIMTLLRQHGEISRAVEDVPRGIRSMTTSENEEIAELIRTHVRQMKRRVEEGQPIRQMDPLFREIFEYHRRIEIRTWDVSGGLRVVETSPDPQVVRLIRQHARRAVTEFVEAGMERAMRPTPLPRGYTS